MSVEHSRQARCDFCRQPLPADPTRLEQDGTTYECCSRTCRDALTETDRVFTEYDGHRRFRPDVAGLDASLPQGIARNSFVMVLGNAGTREGAL